MNQASKVDVCFLQETNIPDFDLNKAEDLWGDKDVEWTHMNSNGACGGSVILWRRNSLKLILSFKGEGYVGVKVQHRGTFINFINVYAPCNSGSRREVWRSLIKLKKKVVGEEWCIGGDFNSTLFKEERIGISSGRSGRESANFMNFVEEMKIIDLPSVGGRFTWFSGNGQAMSRLDRFLLTENLILLWKVDCQVVGKREISDHCPVWLKVGGKDWGPKPFRFNNGWYKHREFDSFLKKEWGLLSVRGRGDFVLYEKLKNLKLKLKDWNKEIYGWIDLSIEEKIDEQHELDQFLAANTGSNIAEVVEAGRLVADDI
ncbi:uncharacterized protein LOC131658395 [Vicia villosa]|uniref:uncharacterized protein LOC131658395 n=1 Tax=Vicia villosa TaxID=3911 RepID=UPI00273BF29C|nr:uncharacterized protein LOC131658395 [Vicia villosa]